MAFRGGRWYLRALALLAVLGTASGCGAPRPGASLPGVVYRRPPVAVASLSWRGNRFWRIHPLPVGDRVTALAVGPDGRVAMGIQVPGHVLGRLGLWQRGRLSLYTPPYPAPTASGFRGTIGPLAWGRTSVWFGANSGVGRFHLASRRFSALYLNVAGGLAPVALADRRGTLFFVLPARRASATAWLAERSSAGQVAGISVAGNVSSASCLSLGPGGHPWMVWNGRTDSYSLSVSDGWRRHRPAVRVRQSGAGLAAGVVRGGRRLWLLTAGSAPARFPYRLQPVNLRGRRPGRMRLLRLPGASAVAPSVEGFTSAGPFLYILLDRSGAAALLVRIRRTPWRERIFPLPPSWPGLGYLAVGGDGRVFVAAGSLLADLVS